MLSPAAVDALVGALRTHRDRAMVDAMVLGGLRRCEVLGLRLEDVNAGQRRLFVAEGKGGRQRIVPVSARFFALAARTIARRLSTVRGSQTDAKLYHEWISNDRKLRKTITRMRQVAAKASELMIIKANKAKV